MLVGAGLGLLATAFLNVQLWPTYTTNRISVSISWPGATAGTMDRSVGHPLDLTLNTLQDVEKVSTYSNAGRSVAWIKFPQGTDMNRALGDVTGLVTSISNFPSEIDRPIIKVASTSERVARLLVSGPFSDHAKLALADQILDRFRSAGVANVAVRGAESPRLFIDVDPIKARAVGVTLSEVSQALDEALRTIPTGTTNYQGERQSSRMLATHGFYDIGQIYIDSRAGPMPLASIADIAWEPAEKSVEVVYPDENGFFLDFRRNPDQNAMIIAADIRKTLNVLRAELPPYITLQLYDVRADQIKDRIWLLAKNGLAGLMLVGLTLFVFLNIRAAVWVLVGIPTVFALSFALMWLTGQSINMVSAFTMVIILGIIVDDAIVVAENITTQQRFEPLYEGAINGSMQVFRPVLTATLTTIAAFLPIFYLTDSLGSYVAAIPSYVSVALAASLFECFFLLPGHMRHSGEAPAKPQLAGNRSAVLRSVYLTLMLRFRLFVRVVYNVRYVSAFLVILFVGSGIALVLSNSVRFQFWLNPESNFVYANFTMVPGSDRGDVERAVNALWSGLEVVESDLYYSPGQLVKTTFGLSGGHFSSQFQVGDENLGAVLVELAENDGNRLQSSQFISHWQKSVGEISELESLEITSYRSGPDGSDVHVRVRASDVGKLQGAINELEAALRQIDGIRFIRNNLNQSKKEHQFALLPRGQEMGFTSQGVGRAIYSALHGERAVQVLQEDRFVDIYVRYSGDALDLETALSSIEVFNSEGIGQNFFDIAHMTLGRAETRLVREDAKLVSDVQASVDRDKLDASAVWSLLDATVLPRIEARYDVTFEFKGRREESNRALDEIQVALSIGLVAIYVIIAWSMGSYSIPIVIMLVLPLGISGALIGHYVLNYKATILSLVSLVALFGILVNDSILIVEEIRRQRAKGISMVKATVNGYTARLRAVFLTSLTTVAGLTPLILEAGYQAQFLIPIAITITWGLTASTAMSFLLIPATIAIGHDLSCLLRLPEPSRREPG